MRGITGKQLNQRMRPRQVNRIFKSIAVKTELDTKQINGHSTRIGTARNLLNSDASIEKLIATVGWSEVDTVMQYFGINNLEAMRSQSTS